MSTEQKIRTILENQLSISPAQLADFLEDSIEPGFDEAEAILLSIYLGYSFLTVINQSQVKMSYADLYRIIFSEWEYDEKLQ